MKRNISQTKHFGDLRKRAEKKIPGSADSIQKMSAPEIQKLVHELEVHQIELEMQNEALRKSQVETEEARYRYSDLYDFAPVGYFTFDRKGHIIEANVTGAFVLGAEKRSIAKQPFRRFVVPEYFSIFHSHLQKTHETRNKQTCELRLVKKDGSLFDAQIDTTAVIDGEGKFDYYRSVITDITEQKQAEQKRAEEVLHESEEKYRNILNSIEDGYHEVDLKGNFAFVTSSMVNILGYEESELIGTNYRKYMGELDAKNVFKAYNEVYRTGIPSKLTGWEFIRKDGTKIAAEGSVSLMKSKGQVIGFRGIIRDVTDKKKAEDTLRKSEEYFRAITENASDIILVVDKKGTITYASPSVDHILGLKPEELIGKSSLDLIVPEDFQRAVNDFGKAVLTEGVLVPNAFRVRHKDGSERVLEGVGKNLFKNPSVAGFVMNVRDVTERKRAEAEMERLATFPKLNPNPIVEADMTGIVQYLNPAAERLFPDIRESRVAHPWLADWEELVNASREGGTEASVREVTVHGRWYLQWINYVEDVERIRIYGLDINERKLAEQQLREREALLNEVGTIAKIGGWEMDMATGKATWSKGTYDIVEIDYDKPIPGLHEHVGYYLPEYREMIGNKMKTLIETKQPMRFEAALKTAKGNIKWCQAYGEAVVKDEKLIRLWGTFQDITERKQAEEALHAANMYNRSLIEASLDPLVTIGPDGRIMDVNAETETVTGYSRAELIGKDFSDYFIDPEKARAGYQEVFREGSLRDYPLEIRHRDGHITTVLYNASVYRNDAGDVMGVFAAARDITERKRAEEELVWKTAFLEAQVEASIDGILVVDDKGKIIQVNTNFINLMKVPQNIRDDTDDKPILQHVTSLVKHPEQFLEKVIYLYEHPREISRDEIEFKDRMVLDRYSSPVIGKDGKYYGRIWTFRNITERKWAEDKLKKYSAELIEKNEEIRQMSEQLWQAAKLATMGELSASIAHELNNPLATVSMRTESLLTKTQQDGPMWRELKIIEQEIERMAIMTANLLQFSRRRQKEISTVDICEEIEKAMELIYYHLRKRNIVIRREFASECPRIHADRQELRQLFLNLFTNASDAMPQGGTLAIRVTAPPESVQVIIEVADTGTGIPPEIMSKVVEPFYTTKPEGKGTGLGLAICRRIVQEHNGTFDLTSEGIPGRGATVRISLPINDGTNSAGLRNQ
jgi:PAS domain S-box-containing protein